LSFEQESDEMMRLMTIAAAAHCETRFIVFLSRT